MKVRMADLWRPVKGVTIKETKAGKFLFHFAHPLDMEAVLNGGPWSFDNNMLILEQVQLGMQIDQIPLYHVNMWVQIHDLPTGLMKEKFGIPLANYIGTFMEYDKNNNSCFWRQYMRLKVRIDVRQPLKRDTKVKDREGKWCTIKFKYEKLGIFCFVCGVMGHAENKCELRFAMEQDDGVRGWSVELRAENRRHGGRLTSRWLREEGGGPSEVHGGDGGSQHNNLAGSTRVEHQQGDVAATLPLAVQNRPNPINPEITTQHDNSVLINGLSANQSHHSHTNFNDNDYQFIPTSNPHQLAVRPNNNPGPSLISHTNPSHRFDFANINSSITNNQFNPLFLNQPEADPHKHQSLTEQILSFSSQPLTRAPHSSKATNHKNSRVPTRSIQNIRPNPCITRNKPDKKTNNLVLSSNPTQTHPNPPATQLLLDDMDSQTEKKRRREEVGADTTESAETRHFLTAGPGSQACRDQ
jgi:14-3-3 protein epsilon